MKLVSHTLPFKRTHIRFLGDFQWAGKNHHSTALSQLKADIQSTLELEQNGDQVFFLGLGDYTDFMSPSNRARLKSAHLYNTTMDVIDQKALDLVHEVYEEALKPTKGKWLGLVEGHHLHEFKHGDTSDMRLCELLDAEFLGTTGLIRLVFQGAQEMEIQATIWFHHGTGNGQTGYYPLTRLEKKAAEWEGVDVFAIGHTTKQAHEFINKVYPRWRGEASDLAHRKVILLGTGGYSRTYIENAVEGQIPRGGYAEQLMFNAAIIGSPLLHLHPRKIEGYRSLDMTAEG